MPTDQSTKITATSLHSFDQAVESALARVQGDPERSGLKGAEVKRMWVTAGGVVGVTQYHVEVRALDPDEAESAPSVEGMGAPDSLDVPWKSRDWKAVRDPKPAASPELRVTGTIEAPSNGYGFKLVRHEPQGVHSHVLLLYLDVDEPKVANDVVTSYPVSYTESSVQEYDTVSILPYGPLGIDVEDVS